MAPNEWHLLFGKRDANTSPIDNVMVPAAKYAAYHVFPLPAYFAAITKERSPLAALLETLSGLLSLTRPGVRGSERQSISDAFEFTTLARSTLGGRRDDCPVANGISARLPRSATR